MIHIGKNTTSTIVSKGISAGHGQNTYRGGVKILKSATGARNYSQCDSMLLGDQCGAHTFPYLEVKNTSSQVEHEALTSKIGEDRSSRWTLMLHLRRRVLHFQVRERVRAALVAQQQRIALRVVARAGGRFQNLHAAAIGVLPVARGNALGHDRARGVLPDVDHLRAGIGLLVIVGQRHRVELAHRVVADQQAARILPGDGRTGLHLGPRNFGIDARGRRPAW